MLNLSPDEVIEKLKQPIPQTRSVHIRLLQADGSGGGGGGLGFTTFTTYGLLSDFDKAYSLLNVELPETREQPPSIHPTSHNVSIV